MSIATAAAAVSATNDDDRSNQLLFGSKRRFASATVPVLDAFGSIWVDPEPAATGKSVTRATENGTAMSGHDQMRRQVLGRVRGNGPERRKPLDRYRCCSCSFQDYLSPPPHQTAERAHWKVTRRNGDAWRVREHAGAIHTDALERAVVLGLTGNACSMQARRDSERHTPSNADVRVVTV